MTETEQTIATKKPVYTISLEDAGWGRDNLEQPGNGRITLGAPEATIENEAGKNTLVVAVRRCARGAFGHDFPYEVIEIQSAYLETPDGDEFSPTDLIDRIEIDGYRRVWSGAYVDAHEGWMTAAEAQKRYDVAPATVRQAINREVKGSHAPEWARKSAGTWLIREDAAEARWGNK